MNKNDNYFKNLKVSRIEFNDYDFIRLFLAYLKINGCMFINRDNLRYDLYDLYKENKYNELFQDIAVKQQIEGNYLDLEESLQNAQLLGLLSDHNLSSTSSKRVILINEDESLSIISSYDDKYSFMMEELVNDLYRNFKDKYIRYHYDGKIKQIKNKYLTMEEKKQLALNGEKVPVCVGKSNFNEGPVKYYSKTIKKKIKL